MNLLVDWVKSQKIEGLKLQLHQAENRAGAQAAQADVVKVRSSSPEDAEIWSATLEEVSDGCLEGPFTAAEITQKLGKNWVHL